MKRLKNFTFAFSIINIAMVFLLFGVRPEYDLLRMIISAIAMLSIVFINIEIRATINKKKQQNFKD